MKLLVLSSLAGSTGNRATAERIGGFLSDGGAEVEMLDVAACRDAAELQDAIEKRGIEGVVGIHAYRAGRLLAGVRRTLPTCIVFGGTDLNEHCRDETKLSIMRLAVSRAAVTVAFAPYMRDIAVEVLGAAPSQCHTIPPSIQTRHASNLPPIASLPLVPDGEQWSLRRELGIQASAVLLLLPCGIRPVKDPLFLARITSRWHCDINNALDDDSDEDVAFKDAQERALVPRPVLVIVGPVLDEQYAEEVLHEVERLPGVFYHPAVAQERLHEAMLESDVVINSSLSEGVSNAVLEAMTLGIPVIVRDVEGNRAIVKHKETGCIFECPEAFLELVQSLMRCRVRHWLEGGSQDCTGERTPGGELCWRAMAGRARQQALEHHSLEAEGRGYRDVVLRAMAECAGWNV